MVLTYWTTDFDGRVVDPAKESLPMTVHGPFASRAAADAWVVAFPEFDDIEDMVVADLNDPTENDDKELGDE